MGTPYRSTGSSGVSLPQANLPVALARAATSRRPRAGPAAPPGSGRTPSSCVASVKCRLRAPVADDVVTKCRRRCLSAVVVDDVAQLSVHRGNRQANSTILVILRLSRLFVY